MCERYVNDDQRWTKYIWDQNTLHKIVKHAGEWTFLQTEMRIYYFFHYVSKIILLFIQNHYTFRAHKRSSVTIAVNSAFDFIIIVSRTSINKINSFDMKQFIYTHYTRENLFSFISFSIFYSGFHSPKKPIIVDQP